MNLRLALKSALLSLGILFMNAIAFAQDSTVASVTTTSTSTSETTEIAPWMWIVGGAVLLLILIALLRPKNASTDRVTVTKTVEKD